MHVYQAIATPDAVARRRLTSRQIVTALGASLLFWTLVCLALAISTTIDQQRAGHAVTLIRVFGQYWPAMLPQMAFSFVAGLVLMRRPAWLAQPRQVALVMLVAVPVYLLLSTCLLVGLQMWRQGKELAQFGAALAQWPATNIWIDAVTSSSGLGVQMGWAYWRQAQAQQQLALQTSADNLRLRLTLLQGQLEPHFLFNTLNSIAALVRGAERGVALQAINRLSELLRYALRASQQPWVSLADELRFVEDYIALQRLRFGEALHWQTQIDSEDWATWACPPLLLQPLVENAVRHGLESAEPGQHAVLSLSVKRQDAQLHMVLRNPRRSDSQTAAGHGVGLSATRTRLAALYDGQATLAVRAGADTFELQLSLPLSRLDTLLANDEETRHAYRADRG